MSKKRAKSGLGSAGAQRWEQTLLQTPFTEEGKWDATIAFVIGNQLEDYSYIDTLTEVVNSGLRRLFTIITKKDLYAQVRELGNPKVKKPKEIPANYEICEPCKEYLDNNEEIPPPLLAKLIKFRLLDIKQRDLRRREDDKKRASSSKADKGGGKKGDKKERGKSPGKGKGGKKTPEPPSAKADTKLKKRGEEDTEGKFIDDEPDDGPQHYVLITGFHNPHLVSYLAELNLIIRCVIKVQSEDYQRFEPPVAPEQDQIAALDKDEKQIVEEEAAKVRQKVESAELAQFWKDLLPLLQKVPDDSCLQDVARLEYIVKDSIIPDNLEDNEKKTEFGTVLFEDVACLVYNLLDAHRQWKNFLANLHLLHIPDFGDPIPQEKADAGSQRSATPGPGTGPSGGGSSEAEDSSGSDVDMRYYTELMNSIPQESASVPLIMHCMLEQIEATEQKKEPPSETPRVTRTDGMEDSLAEHIGNIAFKLALTAEEVQALSSDFEVPKRPIEPSKQPVLITHNDTLAHRVQHLQAIPGLDPRDAELQMIKQLPFSEFCHIPKLSEKTAKERGTRLQEMLHFTARGEITHAEIDHAFKQFVLECMDFTGCDPENGDIIPLDQNSQMSAIPWDDPFPIYKFMIPSPEEQEEHNTKLEIMEENLNSVSQNATSAFPVDNEKTAEEVENIFEKQGRPDSSSSSGSRKSRSRKRKGGSKTPQSPVPETPVTPPPSQADTHKEGSRPGSAGILKSPSRSRGGSANSRRSSTHSVHFDESADLALQPENEVADEIPDQGREKSNLDDKSHTSDIVDTQKRNLDQWCFAEHLEPEVLLQVMHEASYRLPYMDTYYHKRDHSLFVVLHNPYNQTLKNEVTWHTKVHSNVGFRNYLEYIADDIDQWTREEESKHEALLLAKEVEKIQNETEDTSRPTSVKEKKSRSKSPKKSASRAGKSPSRASSSERSEGSNIFIRAGSLKAQKEELDRMKAEEEDRERQKSEKRARSAQKKASKEVAADDDKKKRSASRSSSKSRVSKENLDSPEDGALQQEPQEEGPYWPFTGYDVGNNLLHASGKIVTMFPADGGQIHTEKSEFEQGGVSVKTSLLKDGHIFSVHVLDPKDPNKSIQSVNSQSEGFSVTDKEEEEKADVEKSEKEDPEELSNANSTLPVKKLCVGRFSSFTAQFNDGLSVAVSTYGPQGEPEGGKPYEPEPYTLPTPRSPSPAAKDAQTKGKGQKGDKGKTAPTPEPPKSEGGEEDEKEEEKTEVPKVDQPFQQLYICCPDGLKVDFLLESSLGIFPESEDQRRLLVRQNYPFCTLGSQPCESRRKSGFEEASRVVAADGTVIKTMKDSTVKVLYADGTVSEFGPTTLPVSASRSDSPQRAVSAKSQTGRETPTKKGRGSRKSAKKKVEEEQETMEEDPLSKSQWLTTLPSGERVATRLDGAKLEVKPVLVCEASDPQTGQVMHTREDHVVTVTHPDGTTLVEHADGTRISTFISTLEVAHHDPDFQETGEIPEIETKTLKFIHVECPGFAAIKFDCSTTDCSVELGTGTMIQAFPSGSYDVYHHEGSHLALDKEGSAVYYPRPNNDIKMQGSVQQLQYNISHCDQNLVETTDNEGNMFKVTNMGETSVLLAHGEETIAEETGEEETDNKDYHEKLVIEKRFVHYKHHAPRFFIIHPDESGIELLRYQDVVEYISNAEDDPTSAILMDPLPDCPGVLGITILRPYQSEVSKKWLKTYVQESFMPPGLTSRDLRTLPPIEPNKVFPKFGTNVGQGLEIGNASRPPLPMPMLKCPDRLEVRQIIQFKPVSQSLREKLMHSLLEYGDFVRERLDLSKSLLVQDPRSEEERIHAADLQALSQIQSQPSDLGTFDRPASQIGGDIKALYEKATAPPPPSPAPTPQPKRSREDWARDEQEREDEQRAKDALKNHDVPPYFQSEMGQAFLHSQIHGKGSSPRETSTAPQDSSSAAVRSEQANTPTGSTPQPDGASEGYVGSSPTRNPVPPAAGSVENTPSPQRDMSINTPSALRPGNPTPAHATGQGSPAPVRPHNPTPGHANKEMPDRPVAPTPKEACANPPPHASTTPSSHPQPSVQDNIPEEGDTSREIPSAESDLIFTRSLQVNVLGEPRNEPVRIPAYITKNGRPSGSANDRFLLTEEPVRRQVNTSSIAGASGKGTHTLVSLRGFELLPDQVNFGILKEGNTYSFVVNLKNTGVDSCRFKIRQPPPATGMKVIYKPGPVAAGMKAELNVEIYAMAVGVEGENSMGIISHNLEIITETHHLSLPITATVLTGQEYDHRGEDSPKGGKAPGVKFVSSKPPAGQGIIRPRRDQLAGATMVATG